MSSKRKKPATVSKVQIKPRNTSQEFLIQSINENDITFAVGPAGTGKTLLATHSALKFFQELQFQKIVFCRPAVTVDEDLGALPGDLKGKLTPFMLPIFDALEWYLSPEVIDEMIEEKKIEIASIGHMRGRSFHRCVIVVDEAQNLTEEQMKMVLTRFGEGCKMIVGGDLTQCDLPKNKKSGLQMVKDKIVPRLPAGVGYVEFTVRDVERHPLVAEILKVIG